MLTMKPSFLRQGTQEQGNAEKVKVYLRIRPLTEIEKDRGEEQVRLTVQLYVKSN